MRELENLKEAGSRGAGLRILIGKKTGASYTSDLSREGIEHLVKSAIELADITTEDPHAGLPEPEELGALAGDLQLYSPDVEQLETALKIETARRAEEAALSADPRIFNSEGASFDTHVGRHIFANSRGFAGEYRATYCSLSAIPVARDGDSMERDYWYTIARGFAQLESPEEVGRTAAQRALRRLHAVKVDTQKVPVVFEPRTARTLLDNLFEAVHGMSIYRHESFLAGKLGEKVASENVTVADDGTMPGLFGTSPFDDEGVPSRRTVVIERGVLKNYLLNTYAARKLGMKTTGNAARGLTGKGRPNAGADHCGDSQRVLCDRADGFRREHRDRGLLARRGRVVDSQRRAGVRGIGGHHRRELEGHAAGHGSGRLGPGVPRLGSGPHIEDWRNDRWRQIRRQPRRRSRSRSRRWRL